MSALAGAWLAVASSSMEMAVVMYAMVLGLVALGVGAWSKREALAREGGWLAGVSLGALALRLIVPWGPMNFAEAIRVRHLFVDFGGRHHLFFGADGILALAREAGWGSLAFYRLVGPVLGALTVAAFGAWLLVLGYRRQEAMLGTVVLAILATHVRYSASWTTTIPGVLFVVLAFLFVSLEGIPRWWRVVGTASFGALMVYTRPEYRLLMLPLAALALGPPWKRREQLFGAGLLALAFLPYLPYLQAGGDSHGRYPWSLHALNLLWRPALFPGWWAPLAALGLLSGRLPRLQRGSFAAAAGLMLFVYSRFGIENNPLWGQHRYYLVLVPFALALGLAAVASLRELFPTLSVERAAWALTGVSFVASLFVYWLPLDLQREFRYLLRTSPTMATERRPIFAMPDDRGHDVASCARNLTALSLVSQGFLRNASHDGRGRPDGLPFATYLMERDIFPPQKREKPAAMYLGMYRHPDFMADLQAVYTLRPITTERLRAVPMTGAYHLNLDADDHRRILGVLRPRKFEVGWHELIPKDNP